MEFPIVIGMDWADEKHDLYCIDQRNGSCQTSQLKQSPEAIDMWATELRQAYSGIKIVVCLEQTRGPLIYALMKYDFLLLVPINPKQLARFREVLKCSGAKNDPTDARLLAELFLKHGNHLRIWKPDDEQTRLLGLLNEDRRKAVNDRTRLKNRLKSELKLYFPQALQLVRKGQIAVLTALLLRWPSLDEIQRVGEEEIREFYRREGCRKKTLIGKYVQIIHSAKPLTTDRAIVESRQIAVYALARQIHELNIIVEEYDNKISALFEKHADKAIFESFPAAGDVMAPRLLVAFGTDRNKFDLASEVQALSGVAPVTRKSGKSKVVHRRWACNKFLLQTFHEFAALSRKKSKWAKAYYEQRRATVGHHAAIRALAFKWIRILFRCWQNSETYDEDKYVAALEKRRSPLAQVLSCTTS
jgi:transposase